MTVVMFIIILALKELQVQKTVGEKEILMMTRILDSMFGNMLKKMVMIARIQQLQQVVIIV